MNKTVSEEVKKMEDNFAKQKDFIEKEAARQAALRANDTMSRRQKVEERRLDEAVNTERERVRKEAREQIVEEEAAKAILEKTRDW